MRATILSPKITFYHYDFVPEHEHSAAVSVRRHGLVKTLYVLLDPSTWLGYRSCGIPACDLL